MSHPAHRHFDDLHRRLISQAKSDRDLSGLQFNEKLGIARHVVKKFGDPELIRLLERTRLGSHPALIKLLWRVGQALPPAHQKQQTIAQLFYPGFNP
jgi:hypothetical protein